MMEKVSKQQYVDIWPIPSNDDPINAQIDNTRKVSVQLYPKTPLYSVLYPIFKASLSTQYNALIQLTRNK